MKRRQLFKEFGYGVGVVGGMGVASVLNTASAATYGANVITVGVGGDFATPQAAINSIVDASSINRYIVKLLPGIHSSFDMKQYVSVQGYGINSTIIQTSWGNYVYAISDASISNLKILYTGPNGSSADAGAVRRKTAINNFVFRDIEIEVSGIAGAQGQRWAIYSGSGIFNYVAYNLRIVTDGGGVSTGYGHNFFHGTDIWLTGSNVGLPHIGIRQEHGNRVEFYGGRISTGYFVPNLSGAQGEDVICIYIPNYNGERSGRVTLFDVLMFARNPDAYSGVNVNCIRAENGWVRAFGCFGQAELESDVYNNASRTVYSLFRTSSQPGTGTGGKVETYGCRFSGNDGNLHGGQNLNICHYNNSHDGDTLIIGEGGVALCDAASGAFTLKLHSSVTAPYGEEFVFKKIDSSLNTVIIDPTGGGTIDGASTHVLSLQYDSLRVIWDGSNWFII